MTRKSRSLPAHDEGDPVYEELRILRDGLQEVLGVLTYIARDPAGVERRLAELREFFGMGLSRAKVYLALDPSKNITEVAEAVGMKRQNASKEIQRLREAQLVIPLMSAGRGDVWVRNPTLERVLHLSQKLRQWFPPCALARSAASEAKGPNSDVKL